jgi:HJR/Mrr/RecB family endonuclease
MEAYPDATGGRPVSDQRLDDFGRDIIAADRRPCPRRAGRLVDRPD